MATPTISPNGEYNKARRTRGHCPLGPGTRKAWSAMCLLPFRIYITFLFLVGFLCLWQVRLQFNDIADLNLLTAAETITDSPAVTITDPDNKLRAHNNKAGGLHAPCISCLKTESTASDIITPQAREVAEQIKEDLKRKVLAGSSDNGGKHSQSFDASYEILSFRKQGMVYHMKIRISASGYCVHVRVFHQPLPYMGLGPELQKWELHKTPDDPLKTL